MVSFSKVVFQVTDEFQGFLLLQNLTATPFPSNGSWAQFVKDGLKKHYGNPDYLNLLTNLVSLVYRNEEGTADMPVTSLYQMLISHSQFMPTLLDNKQEYQDRRGLCLERLRIIFHAMYLRSCILYLCFV